MNTTTYPEHWNLEALFNGKSNSPEFFQLIEQTKSQIQELSELIDSINSKSFSIEKMLVENLNGFGVVQLSLSQMSSFVACLLAESPKDSQALILRGKTASLQTEYNAILTRFQQLLSEIDKPQWNALMELEQLKDYQFILNEWREQANSPLSVESEHLLSDLMVDGYHAWGDLYRSTVNNLTVSIEINGTIEDYSIAQATNLRSHPDKKLRHQAAQALENTWRNQQDTMARILNHLTGFRLQADKNRGIPNGLDKPLQDNRIQKETLEAMWQVVSENKNSFASYLTHKAGGNKMSFHDFWAPFDQEKASMDYSLAAEFLLEQFRQFGPELEQFARTAFEEGWIESANSSGKGSVAFCAGFPATGESRVFLTFDGSMTSLLTLTHELGHAFHNHAMKEVEPLNRKYGMTTAESASTFCEMIVLDAAIQKADTPKEKLMLLDEKIKRSVMNFMNLHGRFLFEERLYEKRKEGMLNAEQLNELMKASLDEGYAGSMDDLPVHYWISTPHFYITSSPFYNFPYTFGYLFSVSVYAKALEQGPGFEQQYLALLRDTGKLTVEELAMKHLSEDITQKEFWEKGMALCVKDAEEFIRLSRLASAEG
ncbi:MAG: M3 family oligoendopeptidase [Planococcus sp. (in: firmicutes)]|nr:M3 family oligoendopeptidase [Planococcus sp. (in: firmicutes)]